MDDDSQRPTEISPEEWLATPPGVRALLLTLLPLREQVAVLTARLNLPAARYAEPLDVVRFYRRVVEEARAIPGVRQAGLLRVLPLGECIGDFGIDVEGYDEMANGPAQADWQVATEGTAEALGERLVRGRFLQSGDDENAADVGRLEHEHAVEGAAPVVIGLAGGAVDHVDVHRRDPSVARPGDNARHVRGIVRAMERE